MSERIMFTWNEGKFVAVKPGQPFAGGILTEAGADQVNAGRAQVAAGLDNTVGEKLAAAQLHDARQKGVSTPPGFVSTVMSSFTRGENKIYLNRK